MPGKITTEDAARKRKRGDAQAVASRPDKPRKAAKLVRDRDVTQHEGGTGKQNGDTGIMDLLRSMDKYSNKPKAAVQSAVELCRLLCGMIASQDSKSADAPTLTSQDQVLKGSYKKCIRSLCQWIGSPDPTLETTAITLLMRLTKEEALQSSKRAEQAWKIPSGPFTTLLHALLKTSSAAGGRQFFVETYVEEHDDVRYHTLLAIRQFVQDQAEIAESTLDNILEILLQIEGIPESEDQLQDWLGRAPEPSKNTLLSLAAHRRAAQDAWLLVFRASLSMSQRKKILEAMTVSVLPWFATKLEVLTDFLVDSFNTSASIALIALDGLFHLITTRNLDYPDFYTKLYSLLDPHLLHSKHRNRFFRLLDSCLASSHLPAALIASFLKRLARLALQAPPGAIVWLMPFTYNMLRQHPTCTFMIHRTSHPSHFIYAKHPDYAEAGMDDPFDMIESDPMQTHAIDSSLWELDTLRTHYHPNVATLAGIIAEQFTKREYHVEDFLDHTYTSLLDAELGKDLKKPPVVEFDIPKHIITADSDDGSLNPLGQLLEQAIAAS